MQSERNRVLQPRFDISFVTCKYLKINQFLFIKTIQIDRLKNTILDVILIMVSLKKQEKKNNNSSYNSTRWIKIHVQQTN